MTVKSQTTRRVSRWAVPIALCLAPALVLAEPELPAVEHSDCIIEPMVVVEVGTSVAGVIDEMLVDRSDRVESGQLLARLESSVEEVTVRRSRERADMLSEIRARVADLKLAKQKMQRVSDLYARNMVSKQHREEAVNELERADQAVKIAREKLHLAKLDLEHAQAQLDRRQIRSPIEGVILERLAQAGEYVDERPLLSVAQLDPLRVEVLMPAQAFGVIKPGMTANVMPELAARAPLAAKVVLVDPIIDTASGTFGVRLELPNADYTIPSGMRCRVSFLNDSGGDPIADEPNQALDESGFLAQPVNRPQAEQPPAAVESAPVQSEPADDPVSVAEAPPVSIALPVQPIAGTPPAIELASTQVPAVSYRDIAKLPLVETPEPAEIDIPSPAMLDKQCWRLGPWHKAGVRDAVAAQLDRLGAQTEPQQDTEARGHRWMVYVAGRGGQETADRLTRLALAGFEDLYVIRQGRQRGDISVGVFSRKANAKRRVSQLSERGFAADVAVRRDLVDRYWLQVSGVAETHLDAIDGLAESIKAPTVCADPESQLWFGRQSPERVVSQAD